MVAEYFPKKVFPGCRVGLGMFAVTILPARALTKTLIDWRY